MNAQLFSRGTYLMQLREEYETIYQANEVTGKALKMKAEYRPRLEERVVAAQMAVEAGTAAEVQRNRRRELEVQLQWSNMKETKQVGRQPCRL